MIVVFVSKNDEEFNRYQNGCGEIITGDLPFNFNQSQRGKHDEQKVSNEAVPKASAELDPLEDEEARRAAEDYQEKLKRTVQNISVEYMSPLDSFAEYLKNNVFVVVLRSGEEIKHLKELCKKERYQGEHTKVFISLIAALIKKALPQKERESDEDLIAQDVYLLVHWGELYDPTAEEEVFNAAVCTSGYKEIMGCEKLTIREISSRRPCFDVNGYRIIVPCKKEDVQALLQRFEDGQKYVRIKDVLTKFVVAEDWDDNRDLVCEFFARENVQSDLRAFMGDPQAEWLKSWEAFRTYLDTPNAKLKVAVDAMLQNPNETKKLASQLLSIPQLLKEWIML